MGNLPWSVWENPMDSAKMQETIRSMLSVYPFLDCFCIGKSILGKEIPVLIMGAGKRNFLYVGAHHGMEWITSSVLLCYANEFCHLYRANGKIGKRSVGSLWEQFRIHIVPMLNPDGVNYAIHGVDQHNPLRERVLRMNGGSADLSRWQANARGVDLNHNYNAGFAEYKKLEAVEGIACGAPTRYSGEAPESEPEVRALCNYIRFHHPFGAILTFHTQGEELFWKSHGKAFANSESAIRKLALESGYLLNEAEGLAAYGGLTDWCIGSDLAPAVTFECGKGRNPLPVSDFFSIYARLRSTLFLAPTFFRYREKCCEIPCF